MSITWRLRYVHRDAHHPAAGMDCCAVSVARGKAGHRTYRKLARISIGVQEHPQCLIPGSSFNEVPGSSVINNRLTYWDDGTHRRVLKTMSTMTTKKDSANSACCDRRNERYITSIVLDDGQYYALKERGKDVQKYSVIIAERAEYT